MAVDVIIDPSSGQIYWNDAAGSGTQTIAISGNATNAINIVGYSNFFSPGGGGIGTQTLATFNDSATSTFVPGTNAYDLGSSALRWNFYGTGGNFTGVLSTSSSTASTSTTTGALTVSGGVGIGGSLWTSTTNFTSISGVGFSNSRAQNGFTINATSSFTFNIQDAANNQRLNYHADSNRTEFTGSNAVHEIRLIHSNNSSYTGFKANSSGTVTYTLPAGDGTANQVLYTNGSAALGWTSLSSVSAITSLNGLTASTQTFATGTSGTDFNISSSTSTHTFNIPYAASGATGLVTTQAQTLAGSKTFSSQTIITDTTASTTTATGALLIHGGLGVSGQINSASLVTSGNAVISGNLQFNGVGTFGNATSDTITYNARANSDFLPSADNSYDLGNNSLGWRNFKVSGVGTIATLNISSTTGSGSTTTGALTVAGGVGIGGTINAGPRNLSYTPANLLAGFATSVNAFAQIVLQNASTGATASSDFIVNNDQSTDTTFYGAMGMNSSGYTGSGSFNLPNAVYFTSTSGDLVIGSTTANILRFVYNSGATDSMQITGTAVSVLYNTASTSTSTGAFTVVGGVGIGGSLWTSSSNLASVSGVTLNNGTITGTLSGTATSAQVIATTTDTSSTLYLLGSRSSTGFGGTAVYVDTNISISGNTITATTFSGTASSSTNTANANITLDTTSTIYLTGSRSNASIGSTPIYVLSGVSALGNTITATTFSGTATSATNTANTNITLDTTSTIYLTGSRSNASIGSTPRYVLSGVSALGNTLTATTFVGALTGTASIATSSISSATTTDTSSTLYLLGSRSSTGFAGTTLYVDTNISIAGSQIIAGVWGGTAISAVNGGTGQVSYTIGDILYASTTTALSKLAAGTAGSVLKSNGAGTAPSWQADATGSGGAGTVAAPTASNLVAYYPGTGASVTSNSRVSIDTANSSVEISSQSSKSGLILNAVNGSISNLAELKNSFGDVLWSVGATAQTLRGFGSSLWLDSASTLLLTAPAALSFYNTAETFATSLTGATNATSNLTFILPITAGTAGSVLATNGASGQLYWSAPGTGGGGAGTVASGTSARIAYYPGTGSSVKDATGFEYSTSGTTNTVRVFGGAAIGNTYFIVNGIGTTQIRVGIGVTNPAYELEIEGEISATNKSFVIDHPTKPGKKLRYGSLEGPENGVYVRGELKGSNVIETPDHWEGLVYPDSFTVTLSPIGRFSHLYVEKIEDYKVFIADAYMNPIHCYYTVWAERKDIPKLITEY